MFNIDYDKFITWFVPTRQRKIKVLSLIRCFIVPVKELYIKFSTNRSSNIYKLNHNGQDCYLRKALNDTFDINERRITISDNGDAEVLLIHTDEAQKLVQPDKIIHMDEHYGDSGYDFVVEIPSSINFTMEVELHMKSVINFYKLAGKRYKINIA